MLPFSYFTPIHKARQGAKQYVNSSIQEDGVEAVVGSSIGNNVFGDVDEDEHEDEDAIISQGDSVPAKVVGAKSAISTKLSSSKRQRTGLESLKPPLLVPQSRPDLGARAGPTTNASGVRHRHLAVLTAILHRSLLQYDYDRAAKAWSILIRSEREGHSMDLRYGSRWGLGAEILLRHPYQPSQLKESASLENQRDVEDLTNVNGHLTFAQFEKLREYYNRLSLQYPFNKSVPDATGPVNFHAAMFSFWIYASTVETSKGPYIHAAFDHQERDQLTLQDTLERAREISEELAELTTSPPYSDNDYFKNLKLMVDSWTADVASAQDVVDIPSKIHIAGA